MKQKIKHLLSLLTIVLFFFLATSTGNLLSDQPPELCEDRDPVTVQYEINVSLRDRVTGEPVTGIPVRIKITDLTAERLVPEYNYNNNSEVCRLYVEDVSESIEYPDESGTISITSPSWTHDNENDQTRVLVDIFDSQYTLLSTSQTRIYNDSRAFQFSIKLLDKSQL